jgi:hypothetical protein
VRITRRKSDVHVSAWNQEYHDPLLVCKVYDLYNLALAFFNVKLGKPPPISMNSSAGAAAAASSVGDYDFAFETRGQDSLKQPGSPFSGASSAPSSYTALSLVLDSSFADWQAARPPLQCPCSGFSPRCPVGRVQNVLLGSTYLDDVVTTAAAR